MNALMEVEPLTREDDMREIWRAIRDAQKSAADALAKQAVHEARCEGSQKLIESRLATLLWLAGGVASAAGMGLATFAGWALPKVFGG